MKTDAFANLVAAMIHYLRSAGISTSLLSRYTETTPEQLDSPTMALSPSQLQRLWQLVQSRGLPSLTFSLKVRPLIAEALAQGPVRAETIASRLYMSRHTLYKKLRLENLTFGRLLDDVRREQAITLLKDADRPLVDVAERLGFSEPSAFCRAFKRWMGLSPGAFRQTIA
ncbi:helix-turn-helix transcriptional regulator [Marinobacter sp. JSM 1782161]|uniref:helix-turn-helix transcriptional regulator n=1 Tax=Marinobacter sp. JSM 1782161 TaxID=2685906 RepID=UPI002B1BD297|nr:helix-turn-helix transcriptional regulator [Marinobacter sp. JSM 1782161]